MKWLDNFFVNAHMISTAKLSIALQLVMLLLLCYLVATAK